MHRDRVALHTGAWAAVLLGFSFAVTMLGTTLPTPLYPDLETTFGFGEFVTTVVFAVYPIGVTSALLVAGRWSDQLGRKPMLFAGLAFSAASAVVFLVGDSLWWVFLARLLSGFSAGIFTGTATAAVVDVLGDDGRGRANLIAALANMGGLGLGPLVAGLLAVWTTRPLVWPFVADLGLLVMAVGCLWRVAEPAPRSSPVRLQVQRISIPREIRGVFVRAALAGFAGFAVFGLFGAVSPAFLGDVLHETSPAVVGIVVFAVFAVSLVGQALSSMLDTSRALTIGCANLILGMVFLGLSLPLASMPLLVAGGVVAGLGQGLSFRAGLGSVTAASPPERRAEIASAYFVALYVAIALPVVGEGAAATSIGLVDSGVVFAILVGLLAATVLALLIRSESRQHEPARVVPQVERTGR
jgi:MFS family permease